MPLLIAWKAACGRSAQCPGQVDVPDDRKFVGLDAYQKAINSGVDLVLLCSPPGFRPMHFQAATQ